MVKKVIIDSYYGSGWSTYIDDNKEAARYVATYQPVIEFIEKFKNMNNLPINCYETSYECAVKFKKLNDNAVDLWKSITEDLTKDLLYKFDLKTTHFKWYPVQREYGFLLEVKSIPDDKKFFIDQDEGEEWIRYHDDVVWF